MINPEFVSNHNKFDYDITSFIVMQQSMMDIVVNCKAVFIVHIYAYNDLDLQ